QPQSPLFGILFPELRNLIFTHVLRVQHDLSHPHSRYTHYYRPGVDYARKIETNLLLTCRQIYLETHLAPISLNSHVFWKHSSHGPQGVKTPPSDYNAYLSKMTLQQRAAVQRVHFFTHMPWLERRRAQEWLPGLSGFSLTITIRHSNWSFWDQLQREPLRIHPPTEWGAWIGSMPRIQELVLEFETFDEEKEELEECVLVARKWRFPLEGGGELVHAG
ncbi:hypothetical protein FB45DRAFT_707549, partial [Roridomyces roridus]